MTLQRIYHHFKLKMDDEDGASQSLGVQLLDGWLTEIDLELGFSIVPNTGGFNIFGFNIDTNPVEVDAILDVSGAASYDDPFEDFLGEALEACVYHGSKRVMPMHFLLMQAAAMTVDEIISIRKQFRRGIKSGDLGVFTFHSRTVHATQDVTSELYIDAQVENVIAPEEWSS